MGWAFDKVGLATNKPGAETIIEIFKKKLHLIRIADLEVY